MSNPHRSSGTFSSSLSGRASCLLASHPRLGKGQEGTRVLYLAASSRLIATTRATSSTRAGGRTQYRGALSTTGLFIDRSHRIGVSNVAYASSLSVLMHLLRQLVQSVMHPLLTRGSSRSSLSAGGGAGAGTGDGGGGGGWLRGGGSGRPCTGTSSGGNEHSGHALPNDGGKHADRRIALSHQRGIVRVASRVHLCPGDVKLFDQRFSIFASR